VLLVVVGNIRTKLRQFSKETSNEDAFNLTKFNSRSDSEGIMKSLILFPHVWPEHLKSFNESLLKYPTIDLACGDGRSALSTIIFLTNHPKKNEYVRESGRHNSAIRAAALAATTNGILSLYCVDLFNVENAGGRFIPKKIYPGYEDVLTKENISFYKCDNLTFLRMLPDNSVNITLGMFDISICGVKSYEYRDNFSIRTSTYRALFIYELSRVIAKDAFLLSYGSFLNCARFEGNYVNPKDLDLEFIDPKIPASPELYGMTAHDCSGPTLRGFELYRKIRGKSNPDAAMQVESAIKANFSLERQPVSNGKKKDVGYKKAGEERNSFFDSYDFPF
jgi:hypothetical protein